MERFHSCQGHRSSDTLLLIGDEQAAVFDCGMAFCAGKTIENIKEKLGGRPLDYIFATHTHYDHIAALPFFREEWPNIKLITTEIGAAVLLKDTPRRVIRELSATAAELYSSPIPQYDDNALYADIIAREGDKFPLGGVTVEVIETPGHTRDSVSFYIPEAETMVISETLGVLRPDGGVASSYLTSYLGTVESIKKCMAYPVKRLSTPHHGLADVDPQEFFESSLRAVEDCREFIMDMHRRGLSAEEMEEPFFEKYASPSVLDIQPEAAFRINATATIACTIRELG